MKLPKLQFDWGTVVAAAAFCGLLTLAPRADAIPLAREPFNYPDGTPLGGQSGGTGFVGPWAPVAPAGPSDWVVNNGVAQTTPDADNSLRFMRRGITVPNFTVSPYYFRYDYTLPLLGVGEGGIFGGLSIGPSATFTANDLSLYSQEPYHLRLDLAAGPTMGGAALTYGTNYTIVTRVEPNHASVGAGQSRVTVWVTNAINAAFMSPTDTPYFQVTMNTVITPSFVSLYRESHTVTMVDYDNVFLGTGFGDVVPEPTTMALVSLGVAGLVLRRRHS